MDQTHADPARTKRAGQRYGTDSGTRCFRGVFSGRLGAVWRNDGAPGVDGQTVKQFDDSRKPNWPGCEKNCALSDTAATGPAFGYQKPGTTEKRRWNSHGEFILHLVQYELDLAGLIRFEFVTPGSEAQFLFQRPE